MEITFKRTLSLVLTLCVLIAVTACLMSVTAMASNTNTSIDTSSVETSSDDTSSVEILSSNDETSKNDASKDTANSNKGNSLKSLITELITLACSIVVGVVAVIVYIKLFKRTGY